jgi:hypothetical protein
VPGDGSDKKSTSTRAVLRIATSHDIVVAPAAERVDRRDEGLDPGARRVEAGVAVRRRQVGDA